jgi:hypothetical protein
MEATMQKWNYVLVEDQDPKRLEERINSLGTEGWELVAVTTAERGGITGSGTRFQAWLKLQNPNS